MDEASETVFIAVGVFLPFSNVAEPHIREKFTRRLKLRWFRDRIVVPVRPQEELCEEGSVTVQ
jgi:hypothetical protein